MKIGILGSGLVGETIATALAKRNYDVMMGSRTAGNEKTKKWAKKTGKHATVGTFDDAALYGDLIFICLNGEHALEALRNLNTQNFTHKILVDVTNPLDFSKGMPPKLLDDYTTTSLGEAIQQLIPNAYVVKTLNTVNCNVMVDANKVNSGNHTLFICGNDVNAKNKVGHFLVDNFHWKADKIIDLGGIEAARYTEAIVPFWVVVLQAVGTPLFNFNVVK
jgi:hypothetical protein